MLKSGHINWYEQLHKLQMDITSHCNAACGACVRNYNGGATKAELELKHFDLDLFKRIATEDTRGWYIRQLSLNGNWGDSMMHPHIIEMIKIWTRHHPETMISIATNGAIRSTKFWGELAVALKLAAHHKLDFAMDGMEDTHKLYRRKTSHAKLCENIKAFTDAGGNGVVYMTMFDHNKHQIEEVKELARSLGVRMFKARGSFTGDRTVYIQDDKGNEEYTLKAWYPTDHPERYTENDQQIDQTEKHFDENERMISSLKDGPLFMEINENFSTAFPNHRKSKCPWQDEGEVQIDPWGIVWPCCHISLYGGGASHAKSCMTDIIDLDKELAPGNDNTIKEAMEENDLNKDTLKEILRNHWYNKKLNNAIQGAEWGVCRNNCGVCKD